MPTPRRILALDLGTKLGYASGSVHSPVDLDWVGQLTLATPTDIKRAGLTRMNRRLDPRVGVFFDWLRSKHALTPFDYIVFEDVQFASSTMQTQLWASFRTVVWVFAHQQKLLTECCPVGILKKAGSGYGGADKGQMGAALAAQDERFSWNGKQSFYGAYPITDDAVDAVHLLKWAQRTLKNVA